MIPPQVYQIHKAFKLNGASHDRQSLAALGHRFIKAPEAYKTELGHFILEWLKLDSTIDLQTSGTTSTPKIMVFQKQALVNSALTTGAHFKLRAGASALHCLPAKYVAGKMMLVRALVLGLELDIIPPSSSPLTEDSKTYDFVALTPQQTFGALEYLSRINHLIIGGGAVSAALQHALLERKINAYETYGMTETLSHIAVRSIAAPLSEFYALPGVRIRKDKHNCLVVDAPHLFVENLITHDVIHLFDASHFKLLGRRDHVINSGGVKLQPEQIESLLSTVINLPFFLGSLDDAQLGQRLALVLEATTNLSAQALKTALNQVILGPYERPKTAVVYRSFLRTPTGKIKRQATLDSSWAYQLDLK